MIRLALALAALALPAAARADCPSLESPGAPLSYTARALQMPQSSPVVAGGDQELDTCDSVPGTGFVMAAPDFTIGFDAQGGSVALELRVAAACDAVLLVNTAAGAWLFDDDSNGTDPQIRIEAAPSGRYDVWVGTFGMEACDATLEVESF